MFKEVKIDIRKLRDYCLNPKHPVGKHKARVFASQLGLGKRDAGILKHSEFESRNTVQKSLPRSIGTKCGLKGNRCRNVQ